MGDERSNASTLDDVFPILRLLGAIAAPASLIGSLLIYFGVVRSRAEAHFLGIDEAAFGYSAQEYVLRSVAPMLGPLAVAAAVAALLVIANEVLGDNWEQRTTKCGVRVAAWLSAFCGVLLIGAGALWQWRLGSRHGYWSPLAQGFGACVLAGSLSVLMAKRSATKRPADIRPTPMRSIPLSGRLVLSLIVIFSMFGLVSRLAQAEGAQRMDEFIDGLATRPRVEVFSTDVLGITHTGTSCHEVGDSPFSRRYSGLALLANRNDRYFLQPLVFNAFTGRTIILEESPNIRIETDVSPRSRHLLGLAPPAPVSTPEGLVC